MQGSDEYEIRSDESNRPDSTEISRRMPHQRVCIYSRSMEMHYRKTGKTGGLRQSDRRVRGVRVKLLRVESAMPKVVVHGQSLPSPIKGASMPSLNSPTSSRPTGRRSSDRVSVSGTRASSATGPVNASDWTSPTSASSDSR